MNSEIGIILDEITSGSEDLVSEDDAVVESNSSNEDENNTEANSDQNTETINSNETSSLQSRDFDLNLPASHSYLGSNLEELRGRTILDEGIYINLPLLIERSTVLFPGQTLPMSVMRTNIADMLEKCIKKNRTFGVVCFRDDKFELFGTTAEIYEFMRGSSHEGFRIKAKGRQRFKILKMTQGYHEISANVKIVPEIVLPHPFFEQRLASLDNQRAKPINKEEQKKQDIIERLEAAITHWPAWVYRQYDPHRLAFKIQQQLQFIETKGSIVPSDPVDLSFWVAQNLPLSDSERIMLLKYDCAISRLQWELKYLTNDRVLVCWKCEKPIGKQSDIFPMSKEGPQSTFCNSGGFLHDTVTLYNAENLELHIEPPSSEYSWFPGYAWTIANCSGCSTHMGWKFTADNNPSLKPPSFWGLTRRSLKSKKITTGSNNEVESETDEHNSQSNSEFEFENNFGAY